MTNTGSALTPTSLILPATGEKLELDAPDEKLAEALYEIRDLESRLREAKNTIGRELHERMDKTASWTRRAGEYEIRGSSPAPKVEYDGNDLAVALSLLVEGGKIDQEAAEAALETRIEYKPRKAGINKLLKLGGSIEAGIEATKSESENERRPPYVKKAGT